MEQITTVGTRRVRLRLLGYLLAVLLMGAVQALSVGRNWVAPMHISAIISWLTALYAAVVTTMSLLRYYSRRESIFLFIGLAYFGALFIIGYQSFLLTDIVPLSLPQSLEQHAIAAWYAASSLLIVLLSTSMWFQFRRNKSKPFSLRPAYIYFIVAALSAVVIVFTLVITLPRPFYGHSFFSRPHELILGTLFLVLLLGSLYRSKWRSSSFEYWFTLSLVVLTLSHGMFMSFARESNDLNYVLALVGRMTAFSFVLIGLLGSTYRLFRQSQNRQQQYATLNVSLERERNKTQRALEVLQSKDWELGKNIEELNITKRAMLNVLDDFEAEKRKLSTEKAKDEAIIASVGEGLVVTDIERRVTFLNRAGEILLGRTLAELRGKKWPGVLPAVDESGREISEKESRLEQAIQTMATVIMRRGFYFTRGDGTKFPVSETASPIVVNKQALGGVVVFQDITVEAEVDRAKTEFVSLASHQLRTPLSTVSWYAEMLLSGDAGVLAKEQRQYLQEVYDANRRMVELVNALLNVSRLELGTFAVEPIKTTLAEHAQPVLKELARDIERKHLKLTEKIDPTTPQAMADPNLLRIIFQNLLSNAVKYTPRGGSVSLAIGHAKGGQTFGAQRLPEDSFTIKVKDTGYGIPTRQKHLIFSKLFRADNVKEKDTDGTGLGLYIVKSIIDQVGGVIHFVSREGKGSTFFVTLPLTGMTKRTGTKKLTAARDHA